MPTRTPPSISSILPAAVLPTTLLITGVQLLSAGAHCLHLLFSWLPKSPSAFIWCPLSSPLLHTSRSLPVWTSCLKPFLFLFSAVYSVHCYFCRTTNQGFWKYQLTLHTLHFYLFIFFCWIFLPAFLFLYVQHVLLFCSIILSPLLYFIIYYLVIPLLKSFKIFIFYQ